MKTLLFLTLAILMAGNAMPEELPNHALLNQAKMMRAPRVKYALDNGARIELNSDRKTFYVLWLPKDSDPANPPPMIVSIHGHDGWAFDDFYLWHKAAEERGYGLLSIQWWLGQGERFEDYLIPKEIYGVIDEVLKREHVKPETVLFHGFSRGSSNTYAVAVLDRYLGNHYFALIVANAGKASPDFPPNEEIQDGVYGDKPLENTHWVTYGGGKDKNPERDGIPGMREAGEWIKKYGGTVDLAIEDEESDHGGFHKNAKNMNAALDVFAQRLKK